MGIPLYKGPLVWSFNFSLLLAWKAVDTHVTLLWRIKRNTMHFLWNPGMNHNTVSKKQAITWTYVDISSVSPVTFMRVISQETPQPSITEFCLKITYLNFNSDLPWASELMINHQMTTVPINYISGMPLPCPIPLCELVFTPVFVEGSVGTQGTVPEQLTS